jgi:hypothetical protein
MLTGAALHIITLDTGARKALDVNLELQRRFPGIHVVVKWTQGMNLSQEELVDYLVEDCEDWGDSRQERHKVLAVLRL